MLSISNINIIALLKLFCHASTKLLFGERFASALRRLNNYYMRCSQTGERLTALAIIHCNYEAEINIDTVCKLFMQKHPRRMEKAYLLFD